MKPTKAPKLAPISQISEALEPTYEIIRGWIQKNLEDLTARIFERLEKAEGHNFTAVYPFPSGNDSRQGYIAKREALREAEQWTIEDVEATKALCASLGVSTTMFKAPKVRIPRPDLVEVIAATAAREARESLTGYGYKLSEKVRLTFPDLTVSGAAYSGTSNPWSQSFLSITFADGSQATFTTKVIMNRSVLGKLFNQYPTRLLKK